MKTYRSSPYHRSRNFTQMRIRLLALQLAKTSEWRNEMRSHLAQRLKPTSRMSATPPRLHFAARYLVRSCAGLYRKRDEQYEKKRKRKKNDSQAQRKLRNAWQIARLRSLKSTLHRSSRAWTWHERREDLPHQAASSSPHRGKKIPLPGGSTCTFSQADHSVRSRMTRP